MCGRSYRPRPDNGSGDSPRPPFLSEFVNHIGKLALVEVVYHLFGGTLILRVHPHVERSIRLKTKSACCVVQLQAAYADVGKNSVNSRWSLAVGNFCKRAMQQRHHRPICFADARSPKPDRRNLQRCWILIEPNQMSRCAEAFCDFVTVPAQAHRGVDISPATPHVSKVDRICEKNRNMIW